MRKLTRRQVLLAGTAIASPVALGCGGAHADDAGAPDLPDASDATAPLEDAAVPEATVDAAPTVDARDGSRVAAVVVEVAGPGSVVSGSVQAARVRPIMTRGMMALTGKATEEEAWRTLFAASDVVAIKVNPFGWPKFYTQPATVAEIVRGLNLVGIPNTSIVVYDRYTDYLAQVDYAAQLPAGVRFASAVVTTAEQTSLQGHDPATFVEFAQVDTGLDPSVAQNRRSYLCDVVANQVTKVVNVPVLKSHWTAGVTCALKNMTYGLVNNTARTHAETNWTKDFLPAVAAMAALRSKVVLHIADLLVACYDAGPEPSNSTFDYQSLAFATDPVALDRVCWKILDDQRAKMGLGPVASMSGTEPEYILNCGAAGLGISNLADIEHRSFVV